MRILFFSLSMLLFMGCIGKGVKDGANKKDKEADPAWIYEFYHQDPKDQAEIEENAIIEYLVDHDLLASKTQRGIYYVIEEEGVGPFLIQDEEIKINYRGYFLDDNVFDSSYLRGEPIKFKVGTKIAGWNIGLTRFKSKGKGKLFIPSRFAYGEKGVEGLIPPNTPLGFDIEVIY